MKTYNIVYTIKGKEGHVQLEAKSNLFEWRVNELLDLFNKYCDENKFKNIRMVRIYPAENEEEN